MSTCHIKITLNSVFRQFFYPEYPKTKNKRKIHHKYSLRMDDGIIYIANRWKKYKKVYLNHIRKMCAFTFLFMVGNFRGTKKMVALIHYFNIMVAMMRNLLTKCKKKKKKIIKIKRRRDDYTQNGENFNQER